MLVCNESNQPFLISNTDRSDKHGTLWCSIHNLNIVKNILSRLPKLKQTDNK